MEATTKSASKLRVVLTWVIMVILIIAISAFSFFFFARGHAFGHPPAEESETTPGTFLQFIVFIFAGGFFLVMGIAGYLAVILTGCFTFDYHYPVWSTVKAKQYIANIVVVVALGLGGGFLVAAFVSPLLIASGLDAGLARMVPLFAVLVGIQLMQLWVLIWSPVEKRIITRRLEAMGIAPAQLQGAWLVGLSNPASGLVKRFGAIEEDLGALWVTPQHLMFRGDVEQFDVSHEQVVEIERKSDNRSTTVLVGMAHVILHVRLADNSIRQVRLHVEGLWTLGQKKRKMDALAKAIEEWAQVEVVK